MDGELEFTFDELDQLQTPREFEIFLYSLAEEYDIEDLSEMYEYYLSQEKIGHCRIIDGFNGINRL